MELLLVIAINAILASSTAPGPFSREGGGPRRQVHQHPPSTRHRTLALHR
ncbi:MAG TPA: hypothetical protein PLX89_22790 [Verrucomicrobiota bacterium]|nr:hypothetical protein [Verrucomicrobiota bacterium]